MKYGSAPKDLGYVNNNNDEMMFVMYMPIMMAFDIENPSYEIEGGFNIPENLKFVFPLLTQVFWDCTPNNKKYVYLTAKTLFVHPGSSGNRPGWHTDGFGSNGDVNYIWYDINPTEFAIQDFENISKDDKQSMIDIENQIDYDKIITYPNKHLLRLDESVIHRVNPKIESGIRTFIKISVSEHKYNLRGNAHNYLFDYEWDMYERGPDRNLDNKDCKL